MDIKKTIRNLEKSNMDVYFVKTKDEIIPVLKSLIKDGSTVAVGGSVTLADSGVIDFIRSGNYAFLDRYAPNLTADEIRDIFVKSFGCDSYITGTNAITENGELYNVDGNGNRVAAMIFGPKQVIVIAGTNKITSDITEAVSRVKRIAAPKNAKRLSSNTYCMAAGECMHADGGCNSMAEGCESPGRICRNYVIMGPQREKGRIKIILADEPLGY